MTTMTSSVLYEHADLGRIYAPVALTRALSLPGRPAHTPPAGEYGVCVAVQKRPVYDEAGVLRKMAMIWHSVTHNERVNQGALRQDVAVFQSTAMAFTTIALASATLTKTATDLSLGSATAAVTTNEFTTLGLARAVGTLGTYTAPTALGGQFSQPLSKTFTATGNATVYGSGLFDSVTVASSSQYCEDNFSSTAVMVNADSLTATWTIQN